MDIVWEDPPPSNTGRKRSTKYDEYLVAMDANPGHTLKIGPLYSHQEAKTAYQFFTYRTRTGKGSYEVTLRVDIPDTTWNVYVCKVIN